MAKLLKFIIYSNLLISCGALVFFKTGAKLLHAAPVSIRAQVLIFSATFLIYNLNIFLIHLLRKRKKQRKEGKLAWFWKNKKLLLSLLGLSLLALLWSFPYHSWQESLFFIQLGLISVLYNVPDRYAQTKFRSIRSIPLIKIFLIAYVWASIGAFYPALLAQDLNREVMLLFCLFFIFILAITLPFDIRDYYGDKRASLLTVPGVVGIRATKILALILMLLYSLGLILFFGQWLAAVILYFITAFLVAGSTAKRPDWYFTGIVDSLLLLQFLLVF